MNQPIKSPTPTTYSQSYFMTAWRENIARFVVLTPTGKCTEKKLLPNQ